MYARSACQAVLAGRSTLTLGRMRSAPFIVCVLLGSQQAGNATDVLRVSICDLRATPGKFAGTLVEVKGQTEGNWFESAPLLDPQCSQDGGLQLESDSAKSGLGRLRRASIVADEAEDPTVRGVVATLRGRFEYRANDLYKYVLVVSKVQYISPDRVPTAIPSIPPRRKQP